MVLHQTILDIGLSKHIMDMLQIQIACKAFFVHQELYLIHLIFSQPRMFLMTSQKKILIINDIGGSGGAEKILMHFSEFLHNPFQLL